MPNNCLFHATENFDLFSDSSSIKAVPYFEPEPPVRLLLFVPKTTGISTVTGTT